MKKLTIAIDGPSASGKSTIAKIIAKKLNYIYIDHPSGCRPQLLELYPFYRRHCRHHTIGRNGGREVYPFTLCLAWHLLASDRRELCHHGSLALHAATHHAGTF